MEKWVLITGATRGIGKAIALEFALNGYNIFLNYHTNKEKALNLQKEITDKYNVLVKCLKFDVASSKEVKEAMQDIPKLDVLVNNAGIARDNDYFNKSKEEFMQVLETNLGGTFLVTKYAVPKMDEGVIINVASNAGIDDYCEYSLDYDASKAGVINLTHNFAQALAPKIRVNAVAPGWIKTDMTSSLEPNFKKEIIDKCLLKRMGSPEEVAKVVYFLASEEASYINDTIVRIDGGLKK